MRLSGNPARYCTKAASALLLALIAAPASAYNESSDSRRAGVFLISGSPAEIFFHRPEQLQDLREHCRRGKPVYTDGRNGPFRCEVRDVSPDDPEFSGQTVVEVHGSWPKEDGIHGRVFTVRPQTTRWAARPLTFEEKAALPKLLEDDPARHGSLWRELKLDAAIAVSRPGGARVTYLVPGKRFHDPELGESWQRHHVFVGRDGSYRYQGHIPDAAKRFYDIDGDDIPEPLTDTPCDGACIDLWELHSGVRRVASISGH